MKTTISFLALVLAAVPAQAQLFTPSTVGGAALGAIAGGVIGNNSGSHNGTQGAVIGAVAGGLLGSVYGQSQRETSPYYNTGGPSYYYSSGPSYAPQTYYSTPESARPSYTATTTLLGGVAGAIIGHNNGRHTWQGAAIGAGSGYLFGRLTEPSRTARPVSGAPASQPQQITIINNYYGGATTPMSNANSMFGR